MKRSKYLVLSICILTALSFVCVSALALVKYGWVITPKDGFSRNGALCKEWASCHVCGEDDPKAINDHYSRARIVNKDNGNKIISDSGRQYNKTGEQTSYAEAEAANAAVYAGQAFWGDVY